MPDFSSWERSDVMALAALFISGIALLFSGLAALATYWQAHVAAQARRDAVEAELPFVQQMSTEPIGRWPGAFFLRLQVRNMGTRPMIVERIAIQSRGYAFDHSDVAFRQTRGVNASPEFVEQMPFGTRALKLARRVADINISSEHNRPVTFIDLIIVPKSGIFLEILRRFHRPAFISFKIFLVTNTTTDAKVTIKHRTELPIITNDQ